MDHSAQNEKKENCHHHKNGNHCGMNSTWFWIFIGAGAVLLFALSK